MKKRLLTRLNGPVTEQGAALLCLAVCFAVGAVGGCCFAGALGPEAGTRLVGCFGGYFSSLQTESAALPSLPATAWELARWPLLCVLLGFTALGVVGLPVVFCARGFLHCYAVSVFVRLYGGAGLPAALAVFGVSGFLTLPVLFILGVDAFRSSGALAWKLLGGGRTSSLPRRGRLLRTCCCFALLAVGVVFQTQLTPALLSTAVKRLG